MQWRRLVLVPWAHIECVFFVEDEDGDVTSVGLSRPMHHA